MGNPHSDNVAWRRKAWSLFSTPRPAEIYEIGTAGKSGTEEIREKARKIILNISDLFGWYNRCDLDTAASAVKSSRLVNLGPSIPAMELWVISFVVLFFELAIIRWIPSNISLLSYFSNVVLISCFLGLGTGCVLKIKRDLLPFIGVVILVLLLLTRYFHQFGIQLPLPGEAYFFGATGKHRWLYVVPIVFLLTALPFVMLGQRLARSMEEFSSIRGYSINIFGSLAGTLILALFSYFGEAPTVWFLLAFLLMCWLLRKDRILLLINVLLFALSMNMIYQLGKNSIWFPLQQN